MLQIGDKAHLHMGKSLSFTLASGYFAVHGILPLEAILPLQFMCVYISMFATILVVMLWCVNSAAALKFNGYGLRSSLAAG